MQIINATKGTTKRTLNLMLDRGQTIQIAPGETSIVLTASVNSIKAAINSGTPDEIGIVLGGSWEESIANTVTGGYPYYYTNMNEAKERLFNNAEVASDEPEDKKDTTQIDNLKLQIDELLAKNAELIANNKELTEKLESIEVNSNNSAEVDILKLELDKLRSDYEQIQIENKELKSINEGKNNDLETYKAKLAESENSYNQLQKDYKIVSDNLSANEKKIEDMRATFNQVCDQFGIDFDETKGWYIKSES